MAFDPNSIPKEVLENFKNRQAVFFVGAGLSISAGLPTWHGLMEMLIQEIENASYSTPEKIAEYRGLLGDSSKILFLAEELKGELGAKFNDLMSDWFGKPNVKPTLNHNLLVEIPSNLIITLNYDRLIENAFNSVIGYFPLAYTYTQDDIRQAANLYWKKEFFILKAHGDATKNSAGLILSQKDYRRVLYREPGYRSLLQTIFTSYSVVFIGVSLNDPEFNQMLDFLHDSFHSGGPTHYALLEDSNLPSIVKKGYMEFFKIHTIPYKNTSKNHSEVTEFLQYLMDNTK